MAVNFTVNKIKNFTLQKFFFEECCLIMFSMKYEYIFDRMFGNILKMVREIINYNICEFSAIFSLKIIISFHEALLIHIS